MLAIYRPIDREHAGTVDDPIPWVYGMDCLAGRCYSYNGAVYRVADGGRIPTAISGLLVASLWITALLVPRLVAAAVPVPLGIPKVDVIGHDLSRTALVTIPVGPVPDLEAALHHSHATLGEIAAGKLSVKLLVPLCDGA